MSAEQMAKIRVVRKEDLVAADSSPGIDRQRAFDSETVLVIRSRVAGGTSSGWHHHGDRDVYGYMVAGRGRFESGPGGREVAEVGPGDFFHVPAGTVHRDVNPDDEEEQVVVICFVGTGPLVVNVDLPDVVY